MHFVLSDRRNTVKRSLFSISACCILFIPVQQLQASGACCSISPAGANQTGIGVIASSAWSHEKIGGTRYDLQQQAIMARGIIPITQSIFLSGTAGLPLRTSLHTSVGKSRGSLGWILGAGAGLVLPPIIDPLDVILMGSYNHSEGNLTRTEGGSDIDARFVISELQAVIVGEYPIFSEIVGYCGGRFYSGTNKIRDQNSRVTVSGEREGSVSPFLGIRGEFWEGMSLGVEGSLGHTRILSLALTVIL